MRTIRSNKLKSRLLLSLPLALLAATPLFAQTYVVGRTVDGQPDLQGLWTNDTITPIERPASMEGRAFLSEDEIASMEAGLAERREFSDNNIVVEVGGNIGGYNQIWLDSGDTVLSTGQTSMIVEPANGRAPIREEAAARRDYGFANVENHYVNHTVWDRCITRGVPGSMLPAGYNNAYRFIQTEDSFTIIHEMIHDVRVIPLKKDTHIDSKVKLWMGDSVAHWEGDTLIINTRNWYHEYNLRGMSKQAVVEERIRRLDDTTLEYDFTVNDPLSWDESWSAKFPLRESADPIYEYACHEGNHGLVGILAGWRYQEALGNNGDGSPLSATGVVETEEN